MKYTKISTIMVILFTLSACDNNTASSSKDIIKNNDYELVLFPRISHRFDDIGFNHIPSNLILAGQKDSTPIEVTVTLTNIDKHNSDCQIWLYPKEGGSYTNDFEIKNSEKSVGYINNETYLDYVQGSIGYIYR